MGIRASARVILGAVVSFGMLAMVPGVAFAAQPACGDTLMANTTLTADLDCSAYAGNALTLGKNGIKLNLGGHTLTGYTGDDTNAAVYTERKDTTITNGTIQDAGYSVYLYGAKGTTVSSLTLNAEAIASTKDLGVYVEYGVNNTVSHVTTNGQYYGIFLYGSASNSVSYNTTTADDIGIYSEYDSRDTFSHNTTHAPYGIYNDYSGGSSYLYNTTNGGAGDGMYIDCDDYGPATVIGNTSNNNGDEGIVTYYCYVDPPGAPEPTLVMGNTANGNASYGFYDYYSIGATFTKNTANSNGSDGFYFDYPGDHHITRNVAKHNTDSGIELADNYGIGYGVPADISRNVLKWNDYGIYANYAVPDGVCHGNTIRHNTTDDFFSVNCS